MSLLVWSVWLITFFFFKFIQVFAELNNLADEIASHQLVSPTLIIIGKVVALSPLWPHSTEGAPILVEAKL